MWIEGCHFHDCNGAAIVGDTNGAMVVLDTIISKCTGNGITITCKSAVAINKIFNCIIDGNTGDGINILDQSAAAYCQIYNNIISNHAGSGKFGITVGSGTLARSTAARDSLTTIPTTTTVLT